MDIKRNQRSHFQLSKSFIIGALFAAITAITAWLLNRQESLIQLDPSTLWLDQVQQGDLQRQVKGFGVLESKKQKYLTAQFSAVVEELYLLPGASVLADSVIIKLTNPEIDQDVIQAELALKAEEVTLSQLKLTHKKEKLDSEINLSELKLDLQVTGSKLAAEKQLAQKGVVSKIELLTTESSYEKLSNREQNLRHKLSQLDLFHTQALQIQQEKIQQKQSLLAVAKSKQQNLEITAGFDGVLQALPVELGQSVSQGSQLALVGESHSMIALVQIPQRDVQGIKPGMTAEIDTRGGHAKGKVKRINPVVNEGRVEVEIELFGKLPENARPSLNIEATIFLETLENILYVNAPINSQQDSRLQVFKIAKQSSQSHQIATKDWLEFGVRSGPFIQVITGASKDDQLILSDMRQYQAHNQLIIKK